MTEAAEVFKAAWEKRHEQWLEETKGDAGYPTVESHRTQAGLESVAASIVEDASKLDDDVLGLPGFVEGVIYATRMMRGVEYP